MEYIAESPHGKLFRVKQENLHLIPKISGWRVHKNRMYSSYYNQKTGKLSKKLAAVKEIRTKQDVEAIGATYASEFDLLFGRLKEFSK